MEDRFAKGALMRIVDLESRILDVGLTNYSAFNLCKVMGRKTSEIEYILSQAFYPEAMHRDNLLLDEAL